MAVIVEIVIASCSIGAAIFLALLIYGCASCAQ